MTPHDLQALALGPALSLLPPVMDSPEARGMLLAIAGQESNFAHRHQVGGPAHGFWQFERAGVSGVLKHPATSELAAHVANRLVYPATITSVHEAIEHNDLLAAVFARLLLWTLPHPLPREDQPEIGWSQYLEAWRPGKPRENHWAGHWAEGWRAVG